MKEDLKLKEGIIAGICILMICSALASAALVLALAQPTPFFISGWVNYNNGDPVNNPRVTITNLNTSEVFDAETKVSSNYYQVLTQTQVRAGDVLNFNVRDNSNVTEFNHTVTQEETNNGGILDFNISLEAAEVLPSIFDTCSPENPYPSIFGTHNGTITPNKTIAVNKMFTYSCPRTGGHSEDAVFYYPNGTKIAEGHWNGYKDDWHNITFDVPFTLEAGETYNYTIKTGSYPQIHHTDELDVDSGIIRCDEFIDANGKRYNDWIPAIKLF